MKCTCGAKLAPPDTKNLLMCCRRCGAPWYSRRSTWHAYNAATYDGADLTFVPWKPVIRGHFDPDNYPLARVSNEDLVQRWNEGLTLQQIGERYGVTRERIRQRLRKIGAPTKRPKRKCEVEGCDKEQIAPLCEMHGRRRKRGLPDWPAPRRGPQHQKNGGCVAYRRMKCRRPECLEARAAYHKWRKEQRKQIALTQGLPEGVKHGSSAASNWSCRCPICKAAQSKFNKAEMARRKRIVRTSGIPAPHGVYTTYSTWGCKCQDCKRAFKEHQAQRLVERLADGSLKHGEPKTYNAGCKCQACKDANTERQKERRRPHAATA